MIGNGNTPPFYNNIQNRNTSLSYGQPSSGSGTNI